VRGVEDLVGNAPGPSNPDDAACRHLHSLKLVERFADRRRDFARRVNVPGEATHVVALAHR
jgi:hypothetical protein